VGSQRRDFVVLAAGLMSPSRASPRFCLVSAGCRRETVGLDTYLAKTVLSNLIVLSGGALLPPLLALYDLPKGGFGASRQCSSDC